MRLCAVVAAAFVSALSFDCDKSPTMPCGQNADKGFGQTDSAVCNSSAVFGFNLLRELVTTDSSPTIVISPLSVSMALGMVYNGAEGETKAAMEKTLGVYGLTRREIDESYKRILETFTKLDPRVLFRSANSLWMREAYPVKQAFIDVLKEYFNAEVKFGLSAEAINQWVSDNTAGKITNIIEQKDIDALDGVAMILNNAIYFKGVWKYQFDEKLTTDAFFHQANGSVIPCKMMNLKDTLSYCETDLFQAVELPYGNSSFSMLLFVPRPSIPVDSLITKFNSAMCNQWLSGFARREGSVFLPRFKLEYGVKLRNVLSALGMAIAFGDCDFSGIGESIQMHDVLHKTFIEVNEEGTEAAAVTSGIMVDSLPASFLCRADKPFSFMITEKKSNTILFIGKVAEPKL